MYADIIIDISHEQLDKTFQYAVPDDMDGSVDIGTSVRVPFGKGNRIITGYVIGLTDKPSYPVDKIKSIDSVVTGKVNVAKSMIKLAAVSYTHLKKNNHKAYTTNNQKGSVAIVGKCIKLPKIGYVRIKPVSYTHLDVYKRQTYNKYKLPELVDECVIWESGNAVSYTHLLKIQ